MKLIIYSAPDSGLAHPVTVNLPVFLVGGAAGVSLSAGADNTLTKRPDGLFVAPPQLSSENW